MLLVFILAVAEGLSQTANASEWDKSVSTSDFDDSKTVILTLPADEPVTAGVFGYAVPTLAIRCQEDTTSIYINFGTFLDTDDMRVEYRIDSEAAQSATWYISTNYEAVGLWRGGQSIPFIRRLLDKDRFLFRLTPYGENTVVAKFSIAGLRDEAEELAEACHWSMDVAQSPSDDSSSANGGTASLGSKNTAPDQSGEVTAKVIDAVRRQIEQRWLIPTGARDAEDLRVTIQIRLAPDGRVITAEIVHSVSDAAVGGQYYRTAAESALRAVLYFQDRPLEGLPPEGLQRMALHGIEV